MIVERRQEIIVIDKKEQRGIIIDITVPADVRIRGKERGKLTCMRREDMSLNFDGCFWWLSGWEQCPTQRNLAMAWIDYRKAYHVVPHNRVEEFLEMFGIAVNVKQFLLSSMKK